MTDRIPSARLFRLQERVLLATVLGTALVVLPGIKEPVMLPKATVVVAGGLLLALLTLAQSVRTGRLHVPVSRPLWLLAGLLGAMAVVTVLSADSATSLVGRYGRYGGMVEYAAYGVLLASVALLYRRRSLDRLTWTLLGSLVVVLAYAALQLVGWDPISWKTSGRNYPYFSSLGNTNFASAYAGILVPLALAAALDRSRGLRLRVLAAGLAAVALGYTLVLGVIQGPVVALVGAGLVLFVHGDVRRLVGHLAQRRGWRVAGVVAAATGVLVGVRLVAFIVSDLPNSLHQRTQLWAAAVSMFSAHPFTGVGLDGYADHFNTYRPVSHAVERGTAFVDAPHQVPLGMLASGGLLLGLMYLFFVVAIGAVLVRGLRSSTGSHRLVLAGYGGAWLAYHVQSLVSLDVPPIAMLHFLTAGAVLALAAPPALRAVGPQVAVPAPRLVAVGLVLLAAAPGLLLILRPVMADVASAAATRAASAGDAPAADQWVDDAVTLMPWEPSYHRALGNRLRLTDQVGSLRAFERAAAMESSSVRYARDAVVQAGRLGDDAAQLRWYDELARRDPKNPATLKEVAAYHLRDGRTERSRALYQQVLSLRPGDATALRGLTATDRTS